MKGVVKFKDVLKRDLKVREVKQAFDREDKFAKRAIRIAILRAKRWFS